MFVWNKNLNGKIILWIKDSFSIIKLYLCSSNQLSQYVLTQNINLRKLTTFYGFAPFWVHPLSGAKLRWPLSAAYLCVVLCGDAWVTAHTCARPLGHCRWPVTVAAGSCWTVDYVYRDMCRLVWTCVSSGSLLWLTTEAMDTGHLVWPPQARL